PDRHGPRQGRARPRHAAGPPRCRPARPPARRAAVRPGELGTDGGTLGGWATHWSAGSLRAALRLALDADRALKSTTLTDERGILVQLVLALGVLQREAA